MAETIKIRRKELAFIEFLKKNYGGWLFVMPLVVGLAMFTIWPIIQSLIYSFHNYNGLRTFKYNGLDNYIKIFTIDADFYKVMSNTFIYAAVSVPLNLALSYVLALIVNQKIKFVGIFRVLYYMPVVIPGIIGGLLWKDLLSYRLGAFNTVFVAFGLPEYTFLSAPGTSMISLFVMNFWGIGGAMVLWLAALKNIPATMYEAAKIEGAGRLVTFVKITVPMSTSMIFFNIVTGIIGALQINSTLIFAEGGKGAGESIYFITVKIFHSAFDNFEMGYASALAWVLFAVIGILTAVVFSTGKWVYYGADN
jgi:ABC-type sugar transport system permease subunit